MEDNEGQIYMTIDKNQVKKLNKKASSVPKDFKDEVTKQFNIDIEQEAIQIQLVKELEDYNYVKNKIVKIADKYGYYKADLQKFYDNYFFRQVSKNINFDSVNSDIIKNLEKDSSINSNELSFIKSKLKNILNKSLFLASIDGFSTNILHVESGVMTANAGDSAQFLFLGRAILAGFNCSNVDVRSSRYDAIIDLDGKLLKIQVKGISTGGSISFKDRDRGGQGIDHTHPRNVGKRITSKDCDIFVAVDKQVGLCYLVPMEEFADPLSDDQAKSVSLSKVEQYKENWDIIKKVADSM